MRCSSRANELGSSTLRLLSLLLSSHLSPSDFFCIGSIITTDSQSITTSFRHTMAFTSSHVRRHLSLATDHDLLYLHVSASILTRIGTLFISYPYPIIRRGRKDEKEAQTTLQRNIKTCSHPSLLPFIPFYMLTPPAFPLSLPPPALPMSHISCIFFKIPALPCLVWPVCRLDPTLHLVCRSLSSSLFSFLCGEGLMYHATAGAGSFRVVAFLKISSAPLAVIGRYRFLMSFCRAPANTIAHRHHYRLAFLAFTCLPITNTA
ncbi:hypothetical protein V8C26DRAFT_307951 [Trichoderma gracile]